MLWCLQEHLPQERRRRSCLQHGGTGAGLAAAQLPSHVPTLQLHGLQPSRLLCPGTFQVRTLEWVAISTSRGSSQPRDRTQVSCVSCIGRWILYHWATRKSRKALDLCACVQKRVHISKWGSVCMQGWELQVIRTDLGCLFPRGETSAMQILAWEYGFYWK